MLITVIPATAEPVSVEEAKADLRMTHSADDDLIARQVSSARSTVEQWTGLALAAATYQQTYGDVYGPVTLPLLPATVDAVTHIDDDERVAVDPFTTDAVLGLVDFDGLSQSVVVEFTAAPGPVPEPLKTAILLLVRAEYEAAPDDAAKLRDAALRTAYPYRRNLGA